MPRKKRTEPAPTVTVAELLLALASYPQDAVVTLGDPFVTLGIAIGDEYQVLWEPF